MLNKEEIKAINEAIKDGINHDTLKNSFESNSISHSVEDLVDLREDYPYKEFPYALSGLSEQSWVDNILSRITITPFIKVKSLIFNDLSIDSRAKGYIKGSKKRNEDFAVLVPRITNPTTIYKKIEVNYDDIRDISDIDSVLFIEEEMKSNIRALIARCILVGNIYDEDSNVIDSYVNPENLRPIALDTDFWTHKVDADVADDGNISNEEIQNGLITFLEDSTSNIGTRGHRGRSLIINEYILSKFLSYNLELGRTMNAELLRSLFMVDNIIPIPKEICYRYHFKESTDPTKKIISYSLGAMIVDLEDYRIGGNKSNERMFSSFDIDFNSYKFLMEKRISGALVKPKHATVLNFVDGSKDVKKVTFKIQNGYWSDETNTDKVYKIMINNGTSGKLNEKYIPSRMIPIDSDYEDNYKLYTVDGTTETEVTEVDTTITDDVVYLYRFPEKEYTIEYDYNGGTAPEKDNPSSYKMSTLNALKFDSPAGSTEAGVFYYFVDEDNFVVPLTSDGKYPDGYKNKTERFKNIFNRKNVKLKAIYEYSEIAFKEEEFKKEFGNVTLSFLINPVFSMEHGHITNDTKFLDFDYLSDLVMFNNIAIINNNEWSDINNMLHAIEYYDIQRDGSFDLSNNNISYIPEDNVEILSGFGILNLSHNKLTDIGSLSKVEVLGFNVSYNNIKDITPITSNIEYRNEQLQYYVFLDASNNKIENIPDLSRLIGLKVLLIQGNMLNDLSLVNWSTSLNILILGIPIDYDLDIPNTIGTILGTILGTIHLNKGSNNIDSLEFANNLSVSSMNGLCIMSNNIIDSTDFSPLYRLTALGTLGIKYQNNEVVLSDATISEIQTYLTDCRIM